MTPTWESLFTYFSMDGEGFQTVRYKKKRKFDEPKGLTKNAAGKADIAPVSGHSNSIDLTNDTMELTDASQDSVYRDSLQSHKKI